jgi:hypothetical protein
MANETIGGPQNSSKMQQGAGALACISGGGTLEDSKMQQSGTGNSGPHSRIWLTHFRQLQPCR